MSIETEFQSTIQNVQNAYNGLNNLGATIPQDKTIENIKSCLDEIYDNLPKTEYQEGTEINLGVTSKGKLDFDNGVVGIGQSSQDSTNGYQLLNCNNIGSYGAIQEILLTPQKNAQGLLEYILANGTNLSSHWYTTNVSCTLPAGTYTFDCKYATSQNVRCLLYFSSNDYIQYNGTPQTFTITEEKTASFVLWAYGTGTENNLKIYPLVYAGTNTDKPYEPYTNGASPNPSYPQTINSVTGNQDVVVSGKNKANLGTFDKETRGVRSTCQNQKIKYNGTTTGGVNLLPNEFNYYSLGILKKGTYTASFHYIGGTYTRPSDVGDAFYFRVPSLGIVISGGANLIVSDWSGTLTLTEDAEVFIQHYVNGAGMVLDNLEYSIQIEKSSTVSPYEPYITPTSYQLSLGDKKLYDECTIVGSPDNWKFVDNRKKVVFNGSEDWAYNFNQSMFRIPVADVKYAPGGSVVANIKSNYYQAQAYTPLYEKQVDYGIAPGTTGNDYIYIRNNDITSVADFKTWLGTHNTEVVYETRQPIETPITDTILISQLNAWYNAHSNNGTTIITSNGNLPMIIKCRGLKGE